jgi:hypothetical protein
MRPWKALLVVMLVSASLVGAAVASALRAPTEDGTLSVRDGRATMLLRVKGSIIGRLAKGNITVTESLDGDATIVVRGAERDRDLNARTSFYAGTNIFFRIADDRKIVVRLNGKGLNFSVVGRGDGWMDGFGDPENGVFFDGSYSLNGEPYHSLPDERTRFDLFSSPSQSGSDARTRG